MRHYCFITGFLRSGTTLIEKMVHSLPGACIGPQPFPFLYYDTKRAFLAARRAADEAYPLGHLFLEKRYRPEEFQAFLDACRLAPDTVAASFAAMRGYKGWQLPGLGALAHDVREGSFVEVYRQLCDRVAALLERPSAQLLGAKEVFCEEFIPSFLRHDVAVLLVLRDVRDVLTSLKGGVGANYGNRRLPVLHILRQWRKSVAFALQFSGMPGFDVLRYEEVVARPRDSLDRLAGRLGLSAAQPGALDDLRDQEGHSWESNSSFAPTRGVSRDAVGRYAAHLPASSLRIVEFLCAPEMACLGMTPSAVRTGERDLTAAVQALAQETQFVAPGQSVRDELDAELARLRLLAAGEASEEEQRHWCIFPRAYRRLAERVA